MSVLVVNDEVMLQHALTDLEFLEEAVAQATILLADCNHLDQDQLGQILTTRNESDLALWRLRNFIEALHA